MFVYNLFNLLIGNNKQNNKHENTDKIQSEGVI